MKTTAKHWATAVICSIALGSLVDLDGPLNREAVIHYDLLLMKPSSTSLWGQFNASRLCQW